MAYRLHLDSHDALLTHLDQFETLRDVLVHGVDLTGSESVLLEADLADVVFLGCVMSPELAGTLVTRGHLVIPSLGRGRPYEPTRSKLYELEELLDGFDPAVPGSEAQTVDRRIYEHYQSFRGGGRLPVLEALAQRVHDHAIDDALGHVLWEHPEGPRKVVGVMGGHAMTRDQAEYRAIAQLGHRLTRRGYFIATGGGPGAMEAANLGAWMAHEDESALDAAVDTLTRATDYRTPEYLVAGAEVRARHPKGAESLAVPTWFYGHEPTNQFALHIAKYFSNSLREDGLLAIAHYGVVYAPGSAGTIQEIFMDAAQNHYHTIKRPGPQGDKARVISPMVFLGRDYWTLDRPVYPLLRVLAFGRRYHEQIGAADHVDDVVRFLEAHPPVFLPDED